MITKLRLLVLPLILLSATALQAQSHWVELESGVAGISRNVARIPGDTGTEIDLQELLGSSVEPHLRVMAGWQINERHELVATFAPFEREGTGQLTEPTFFEGEQFAAGEADAVFRFSSYRLTYRYSLQPRGNWTWKVGATAFVRDAEIALRQGSRSASKTDVGFVPLLHVAAEGKLSERVSTTIDVDAAAATQGRAIDLAAKLHYDFGSGWSLGAGYRTIEGGADNDEVYNFAWLHFATASVRYRF